jgi:predicted DNA-binding protein
MPSGLPERAEASVLHFRHMGNTLTVRLPEELMKRLREKSRRTGLPLGRVVRQSLETTLTKQEEQPWRKYVGVIKGGPPDVSSRKGFSRG